ncbi:MAG: UDP-D-galactose:(glucosyl)lipopolysaccharide-1,6-D-galactosyltransferase [Methanomassiliicoccales archaeon PtaU1.Bin124]|nr:MAG: UDP-D-galactose:(glucosyl)lipopolysaccharide-1,6-D-galactosyltransferase [Methanomassiliicoccales archaeon PtaU1.Bin124]
MAERLRIIQVNAFHYPFRGGIEHRIHHVSKRLAKKHEVIVLTSQLPNSSPEEEIDGYRVVRLPSRYINIYNPPYVTTHGILDRLKELDGDVVDFHYRWAPTYNKAAQRYPGKKAFTFHNTYGEGVGITRIPSVVNDMGWKRHLNDFDRIICVSEFVRHDLEERGVDASKLVAIPNGIENPPVEPSYQEDDFILFVGRLVNTKGLKYLVQAMTKVPARLVICGGGPEERRLRQQISKLGLEDKVELAGKVSEERKTQLMSTCKLFVMPSIFESYGIAVAEAMSYGKPIVASNVGGLPEVVCDAGSLCRPKDHEDLAEKINSLLQDEEGRRECARKAAKHASGYSWDSIADRMDEEYRRIA